ncbi:hypothetical protein ACHAXN_006671 [Cyclotella atomus]
MQVPPMKLNEEQCSNLPFPVGCQVWYNINLDELRCNDISNANALHAAAMEEKWGGLLGASNTTAAKAVLTFNSGIVSAAYLDMNVRSIMYEISPLNDDGETSSPEKSMYSDKELCYGPGTPVHLRPVSSTSDKELTIPGQVLMCRLKQQVSVEHRVTTASLNSTSEQEIWAVKQKLSSDTDDEVIQNELCKLNNADITLEILKSTGIGKVVARLKKSQNETIALLAKELVAKWKDIASQGAKAPDALVPAAKEETAAIGEKTDSSPKFLYTIKVQHCDGCFHLEENVAVDRVKYRRVESANPNHQAVSEPSQQPDRAEMSSNDAPHAPEAIDLEPQAREKVVVTSTANADIHLSFQEHEGCPMASPSTLTHSDTTMGHPYSDSHSQQNSHKRKFEPDQLEESTGQKRPCSSYAEDIGIAPNQHLSGSRGDFVAHVSLDRDHVPQLIGRGGQHIAEIESATGCLIDIRGRGSKHHSDNPLHAKVTGKTQAEVDAAVKTIKDKIRDFEGNGAACEFLPLPNDFRLPKLFGPGGLVIQDIRLKSGCSILLRGKGTESNIEGDGPTHAKIVGAAENITKAKHMIQAALAGNNEGTSIKLIQFRLRENEREDAEEGEIAEPTSMHGNSSCANNGSRFDTSVSLNEDNRPVPQSGIYCKIFIPPWLVYDGPSKARLHHFLLNHEISLDRIGRQRNCVIEIRDWILCDIQMPFYDPSHILIQSKEHLHLNAKDNLRFAKHDVENILQEYIHKDGSQGRLFYDTAISCRFFHRHISATSTTVHQ